MFDQGGPGGLERAGDSLSASVIIRWLLENSVEERGSEGEAARAAHVRNSCSYSLSTQGFWPYFITLVPETAGLLEDCCHSKAITYSLLGGKESHAKGSERYEVLGSPASFPSFH